VAPPLLAIPNVAEGRDAGRIDALERAFSTDATLLDRHTDRDHDRTVFTLAGEPEALTAALARGAAEAIRSIDMTGYGGIHPAIGGLDVSPVVWIDPGDRALARATAVGVAGEVAELGVPVFFYGELASGPERAERAYFRNGGLTELWLRMDTGELRPDRGPARPHPTAGATLVTARPPLGAFNVELDSGDLDLGRAVAAGLRESGGGLTGVRAIGLPLSSGRVQVSTNVQDLTAAPLGTVVERIRSLAAPLGARPVEAELVGLVPAAALGGYPEDVPIRGFDPARQTIERRLEALS
jgi:glutamate formiminotransferase / 5-formyltetrahydrofolate cyclo-ligase